MLSVSGTTSSWHSTAMLSADFEHAKNQSHVENLVKNCLKHYYIESQCLTLESINFVASDHLSDDSFWKQIAAVLFAQEFLEVI